ncbi:MAG: hypothetical protein R3B09_01390 [Nannocystaceae bacterium]
MWDRARRRVTVLYNTDYQPGALDDRSAVQSAAIALYEAIGECGMERELVGIDGVDLWSTMASLRARAPHLVFNLCESLLGDARNEPVVPSALEAIGLPYTGNSADALELCLYKERAKEVLRRAGVPTPEFCLLAGEDDLAAALAEPLDYPYFVKLAHQDASLGIGAQNLVRGPAALASVTRALWRRFDEPVLAERYISGREVNVTLLGDDARGIEILPLHEIDFSSIDERPPIVTYAAKWDPGHLDYQSTPVIPLRETPAPVLAAIIRVATDAYRVLGLRDFGRVDLRIDEDGQPWVIDINPNCDLSPEAGAARAAMRAGIEYPQLIRRICDLAWTRAGDLALGAL